MNTRVTPADGVVRYQRPGVYIQHTLRQRAPAFLTGRPVFIGLPQGTGQPPAGVRFHRLSRWEDFRVRVGDANPVSLLAPAVRGFFENGGTHCVVATCAFESWSALLDDESPHGGPRLSDLEDIDLVCAPDLPAAPGDRLWRQRQILAHCDRMRDRFAILDAPLKAAPTDAVKDWSALVSPNGSLYFPWIQTAVRSGVPRWLPPCGHIAGVYARTDARVGVHKAPANEVIEGAVDVRVHVDADEQSVLNDVGVNCLCSQPGRGIRVWGARTLSAQAEWRYVNVRRLVIAVRGWLEHECRDFVFDSHDAQLWQRVRDRLNNYCYALYQSGALKGETPEESYYVKCDAETNPPEQQHAGRVITEIGLAVTRPAEFIVVRITQEVDGGSTDEGSTITTRS